MNSMKKIKLGEGNPEGAMIKNQKKSFIVEKYVLFLPNLISFQIDRSTFVIECRMAKDSTSWSIKVIGCRTALGTIIKPGQKVNERNTVCALLKYKC